MQTESFYVAVGLLLLAVVLYRVQLLYRAGGDRSVLWYCVGVTLGVPYILLRLPSVHSAIGQAVGTHNIAHPLAMCIVVVGCHLIRPLHRGLHVPTDPATPTRRTAVLLLAAVATIAPTFALVRVAEDSTWFVEHNPAAPFVLEYQLSYSFWLLLGFYWAGMPSWRYGHLSTDPIAKLGIGFLVPCGYALGALALVGDIAFGAAARFGLPYPSDTDPVLVFSALSLLALVALCVGSTLPAWGPGLRASRLLRWFIRYVRYQRMYPLWLRLYWATPSIALLAPSSRLRALVRISDLEFHLYRRVVEIRDGRLALRDFARARVLDAARAVCLDLGLPPAEHELVAAAASLTLAAHAKLQQRPSTEPLLPTLPESGDVDGEARTLARVAHYCTKKHLMGQITRLLNPSTDVV